MPDNNDLVDDHPKQQLQRAPFLIRSSYDHHGSEPKHQHTTLSSSEYSLKSTTHKRINLGE